MLDTRNQRSLRCRVMSLTTRVSRFRADAKRVLAAALTIALTFTNVPIVIAAEPVLGTIQVSGPAFAATAKSDWVRISATRPLVVGDRLKTDTGGHMVADMGKLGVIGLYGNSEIAVVRKEPDIHIDVVRGKVAFHLEPNTRLKVASRGATVGAGTLAADGYVEFDAAGAPVVVCEGDGVSAVLAGGTTKALKRGERLALTGGPDAAPVIVATTEDERKAGAAAAPPEEIRKKYGGLSARAWTALAVVAVAVGVGVGVGVGGGGGGGGGDNSPSGDD